MLQAQLQQSLTARKYLMQMCRIMHTALHIYIYRSKLEANDENRLRFPPGIHSCDICNISLRQTFAKPNPNPKKSTWIVSILNYLTFAFFNKDMNLIRCF